MTHVLTSFDQRTNIGVGLSLRRVGRVFDPDVAALSEVDLDVVAGQFVAILGPSGCGKSTLLRLVAGLDRPTSGHIQVGAGSTPSTGDAGRAELAYVFQDPHLMPWRTVLRNVALPLELHGIRRRARRQAAGRAIDRVGLSDAATRYPAQLSGGMRMRVSLARALVTRPQLLLLDEPFAALDELTRQKLDEQLHQLWRQSGMTVLFVTHSVMEAAFLAQRAVVLSRRPGHVVFDRPLDLPESRTAALRSDPDFLRQCALLYAALERGSA
jgi:NitT/TauT family transport system ATP-binding protein